MKVIVKCHHAIDENYHQINDEEMCTQCAIELTSKIANELIIHQKATLMRSQTPSHILAQRQEHQLLVERYCYARDFES
jgi:hypothetical protein